MSHLISKLLQDLGYFICQHLLVQLHLQKEAPPAKVELQSGIGLTITAINIGYKL